MQKLLLTLMFCAFSLAVSAQSNSKRIRHVFPAWYAPAPGVATHGVSLGLVHFWDGSAPARINGIGVELGIGLLLPIAIGKAPSDATVAEALDIDTSATLQVLNGISLSASGHVSTGDMNGIGLNGIASSVKHMRGVQAALMMCFNWELDGASFAIFFNDDYRVRGAQFAIVGNTSNFHHGLQLGAINSCKKMRGVQIGLGNKSKNLKGLQIGLWNVNQKRRLPLLNWA